MFGNHVFGCDICQEVCPYNLKNRDNVPSFFDMRPELEQTENIAKLLKMKETQFFEKYKFTVIFKSGFTRFLRNVLIAAGNMRDESFLPSIRDHLQAKNPLIRSHAVWAFSQYKTGDARTILEDCLNEEKSPAVISEIRNALAKMD
jgi:epoxyqueuosine reductase